MLVTVATAFEIIYGVSRRPKAIARTISLSDLDMSKAIIKNIEIMVMMADLDPAWYVALWLPDS